MNATYQAICKAGFNKDHFKGLDSIIMLREPEAAAIYTARALKESRQGQDLLKVKIEKSKQFYDILTSAGRRMFYPL
jgi:hypothetical protein